MKVRKSVSKKVMAILLTSTIVVGSEMPIMGKLYSTNHVNAQENTESTVENLSDYDKLKKVYDEVTDSMEKEDSKDNDAKNKYDYKNNYAYKNMNAKEELSKIKSFIDSDNHDNIPPNKLYELAIKYYIALVRGVQSKVISINQSDSRYAEAQKINSEINTGFSKQYSTYKVPFDYDRVELVRHSVEDHIRRSDELLLPREEAQSNPDYDKLQSLLKEIESYSSDEANYNNYLKNDYEEGKKLSPSSDIVTIKNRIELIKDKLASYYNLTILLPVYNMDVINRKISDLEASNKSTSTIKQYKDYFKNEVRTKIMQLDGTKEKTIALANEIKEKLQEIDNLLAGRDASDDGNYNPNVEVGDLGLGDYPYKDVLIKAEKLFRSYRDEKNTENPKIVRGLISLIKQEVAKAKEVKRNPNSFLGSWEYFQQVISKVENRATTIEQSSAPYKQKIQVLREDLIQITAGMNEYKDAHPSTESEIEAYLKKKDPEIVILAKGTVKGYGSQASEKAKFDMIHNALATYSDTIDPNWNTFRIFKTNKGYMIVLTFKGIKRGQPSDNTGEHFNYAHLGKLVDLDSTKPNASIEPMSTYHFYNSQNLPKGMEDTGVEGFRGLFNPKEFVMPLERGEDHFFKVSVAQMGSNAQMGAIRVDWNTLKMTSVDTIQVLNEEINNALSLEKATKTQAAFDKMRETVNQVKNNLANIRTEEEVKAAIKKVTDAVDEFKNSEDSFLSKIAKEMYKQYENLGSLKDSAMENSREIASSYNNLKESVKSLQSEEQIKDKMNDVNIKLSNAKYYNYKKYKLSLVNTNGEPIKNDSLNYKGKVFKFGGASYLDLKLNNSNIQNLQLYINNEQTEPLSKYRISLGGENYNDLIEKISIFNIGTKPLSQYYVKYTDKSKQEHTAILKLDEVKLDLKEMNKKFYSVRAITESQINKYIESNPTENAEIIKTQRDALEKLGKEVKENSYDQEDVNNATTRMHEFLVKLGLEESGDINLPKKEETPSTTETENASKPTLKDGKYIGEGFGYEGGKTVVEVTIQNGKISNIEVKSTEDTDIYFNAAKPIIGKIIKQNGPDYVDTVTNATHSSNGIKRAVSNALEKAKKASAEEASTNPSSNGEGTGSSTNENSGSTGNTSTTGHGSGNTSTTGGSTESTNPTGEGSVVTPSTNNENPVDDESGIYTARIKKYTDDSDSMANGSLNNKEVKIEKLPNGKYKYTLRFNQVHLRNDEGNITNLFVLLDGKHQATKNSDGTWSFVLDENSKRIEIAVWVDIMDAISSAGSDHVIPGKGEQKAILIISDKKENTSAPTPSVVPPTPTIVPPTPAVVPPTPAVVPPTPSASSENKEIYSVPARILNYNENKPSMANASLSSQSVLVEKVDNGYKYTVKLSPIKIQNMEGHINNLFILTPNSKIAANKEDNNNWSFVLPDKSNEVTIAVWVDAMDELASIGGPVIPGKGEQKARLELDWSRISSINEKQANNIKNQASSTVKSDLNPIVNNKLENPQNTEPAVSSVQYEEVSLTANATPEERKELDVRNIKEAKNISGQDRYKTSVEISKKYFKTADDVVLVSGHNNSDAMISSTVAKAHNAPILLADSGKDEFLKEIERLKATKVTIVGGEASIPESIKEELAKRNITVTRLAGKDRYDTSLKVAAYLSERNSMNNAVLVNGRSESDALSVSGLATKEDAPIILVRNQGLTNSDKKELDGLNLNSVYAIGGEKSISKDILQEVNAKNKDRISGKDRYETSLKIAEKVSDNPENIILVSGENSVDALSAGAIAFKTNAPVVLVGKDVDSGLKSMIKKGKKKNAILLGGEKTIGKKIKDFFRGR